MADKSRATTSMRRFGGLVTNEDPHDLKPGQMQAQQNIQVLSAGRLQCRRGMRHVHFANGIPPTSYTVISMAVLIKPEASLILYEDSNGNVRCGRNPT